MFLNIAHRGDSTNAPENTLAAFEAAIVAGASAVELDLRCTADGHVVVMHDRTVDRTTDGDGAIDDAHDPVRSVTTPLLQSFNQLQFAIARHLVSRPAGRCRLGGWCGYLTGHSQGRSSHFALPCKWICG